MGIGLSGETHSFAYDPSYRIASNTEGARGTISYTYDPADHVGSYAIQNGPTGSYAYFDDGSLKSIQWSPTTGQFDFGYTISGQYGTIAFPNGQHRDYTYDDQGRLTQIENLHPVTGDLGTFGYGYDNPLLGQRTSMTSNLGSTNYSYDPNYQLTQANYPNAAPFNGEIDSWSYDNIGNRLTNTVNATTQNYTYFKNGANPLNGQRLQSDGTKTYTYDANGNVTGDGTYTYSWDYENRLTAMTGSGVTASYSYDYLGRRKSKTVNSVTTTYLYDGQNLIREVSASTTDYVFGPGIDEPLASSNASQINYYTADGLGSVATLSDASGAAQNSYVYDAWGLVKSQSAIVANSFTYTARETAEAGLMYYRARYYFPTIGRFISEDPKGFDAGYSSFYSYVSNNPVYNTDPTGLAPCTAAQTMTCADGCRRRGKLFQSCTLFRFDLKCFVIQFTWCSCRSDKCSRVDYRVVGPGEGGGLYVQCRYWCDSGYFKTVDAFKPWWATIDVVCPKVSEP